jgi:hypothetical protein
MIVAYTNDTLLAALTVGQFRELFGAVAAPAARIQAPATQAEPERRYVYGIKGIRELFGVSHTTACTWKNGFLAPAVRQNGRTIVVDADLALELFEKHNR